MDQRSAVSTQDIILQVTETGLGHQSSSMDSVDLKAGVLLSAEAVLLPLLLGSMGEPSWFTLAAAVLLLAGFGLGLAAYFGGPFRYDPDPEELYLKYGDEPSMLVQYVRLYQAIGAYRQNQTVLQRKVFLIRWSMGVLMAALLAVAAGLQWRCPW